VTDGRTAHGDDSARRVRADAQRNVRAVLAAANAVFAGSGVDAPVRQIAARAGVGVGTLYRHFPQRSDLIVAVFRQEIDACADAAEALSDEYGPSEALVLWLRRYTKLIATKRGLAAALHSGDPVFDALPAYFDERLRPVLQSLLKSAATAGEIRSGVEPNELLHAVAHLCLAEEEQSTHRMVDLLIDGLRYGVAAPAAHGESEVG
jgi:AcrR family transcriptional regulator